jgi:hypothetical protein
MSDALPEQSATSSELIFYQAEDGQSRIQVRLDGGTVWLTQRPLAIRTGNCLHAQALSWFVRILSILSRNMLDGSWFSRP